MCDFSLQSFGDFQADSLKYCQAGECQVNETFERIESTAQYRGFSLSQFAAIGDGKKNWKSSLMIEATVRPIGGEMDNLETLLDRCGGENQLTEELTNLYGGPLAFERRS